MSNHHEVKLSVDLGLVWGVIAFALAMFIAAKFIDDMECPKCGHTYGQEVLP